MHHSGQDHALQAQDAASVAGLLVTEAMIAEAPKKDSPMPGGGIDF